MSLNADAGYKSLMNETIDQSFGFTPFFFIIQIAILIVWVALTIAAIRRAVKFTSGAATPLWILLVFLVPFLGAITTIASVKKESS